MERSIEAVQQCTKEDVLSQLLDFLENMSDLMQRVIENNYDTILEDPVPRGGLYQSLITQMKLEPHLCQHYMEDEDFMRTFALYIRSKLVLEPKMHEYIKGLKNPICLNWSRWAITILEKSNPPIIHKILLKNDHEGLCKRFDLEAKAMFMAENVAGIPDLISIIGYNQQDVLKVLKIEYINGENLVDMNDKLSFTDRIRVLSNLLQVLGQLHQSGVIHRDIKPSNIMVAQDLSVHIIDMGVMRLKEGHPNLTHYGEAVGTPSYISPEQAQAKLVDERTDIYAVGMVMYEMISGYLPFDCDNIEQIMRSRIEKIAPELFCEKRGFGIDSGLKKIAAKALERNVDKRYQSAEEFRQDLINWLKMNEDVGQKIESEHSLQILHDLQGIPGIPKVVHVKNREGRFEHHEQSLKKKPSLYNLLDENKSAPLEERVHLLINTMCKALDTLTAIHDKGIEHRGIDATKIRIIDQETVGLFDFSKAIYSKDREPNDSQECVDQSKAIKYVDIVNVYMTFINLIKFIDDGLHQRVIPLCEEILARVIDPHADKPIENIPDLKQAIIEIEKEIIERLIK